MTPAQLADLSEYLGERLEAATTEIADMLKRQTGQMLTPSGVMELRRVIAWHLAFSCAKGLDVSGFNLPRRLTWLQAKRLAWRRWWHRR